jgi:hypothetical protein
MAVDFSGKLAMTWGNIKSKWVLSIILPVSPWLAN